MGSLLLQKEADFLVHDSFTVETEDHEDHTFSGIMFDVEAKVGTLPVAAVVVDAVSVRGGLGNMTVWYTPGGFQGKHETKNQWTKCFSAKVDPSWREFAKLTLQPPLVMLPGERYGLYVHSAERHDEGVVYDNQRSHITHDDNLVTVFPGVAHLSCHPFSDQGPWWGSAWRPSRTFVGQLSYGARYKLWEPNCHSSFNQPFRTGASATFGSLVIGWSGLPADVVLYVLNMCKHDWFDDPNEVEIAPAAPQPSAAPSASADSAYIPRDHSGRMTRLRRIVIRRFSTDYSRFDNINDSDSDEDSEDSSYAP